MWVEPGQAATLERKQSRLGKRGWAGEQLPQRKAIERKYVLIRGVTILQLPGSVQTNFFLFH